MHQNHQHHWVVGKDGNIFKDGRIILTREGGTVDHRVNHSDLVKALEIWREHRRPIETAIDCTESAGLHLREHKLESALGWLKTAVSVIEPMVAPGCDGNCAHHGEFCDRCTCGTRISPHHEAGCPSVESRPFTWQDAERIMLAGGECEQRFERGDEWYRCRIRNGAREFLVEDEVRWGVCPVSEQWPRMIWRPCSAPARYTWEQAEAGMRRGEIWEHREPGSDTWYRTKFDCSFLCSIDDTWLPISVRSPVMKALPDSAWRPYNPEAK